MRLPEKEMVNMFEASLQVLYGTNHLHIDNEIDRFYYNVLIFYLSGDEKWLSKTIKQGSDYFSNSKDIVLKKELEIVLAIAKLRMIILEKDSSQGTSIENIKNELCFEKHSKNILELWEGEWYFVWARVHDLRQENLEASLYYFKARDAYKKIGASKKSIKSYLNGLICLERNENEKTFHYEYIKLIKSAREAKEYVVVAMTMLALSQKLMDIGALKSSFQYVQRAIAFLSRDKGSSNYFKAILQRAHLNYLLGKIDDAKRDCQEAKLSGHIEILQAVKSLENKISQSHINNVQISLLPEAWHSRFDYEKNKLKSLGNQEEELIYLLLKGPKSKDEILDIIWGKTLEKEYLDLRFKKLIWRIKQKFPKLISYQNASYLLNAIV